MAKRKSAQLRDADDLPDRCVTDKKLTLCVGDRVERTIKLPAAKIKEFRAKGFWTGVVTGFTPGQDNQGRAKMAARVRFDGYGPSDKPSKWLFAELKKA